MVCSVPATGLCIRREVNNVATVIRITLIYNARRSTEAEMPGTESTLAFDGRSLWETIMAPARIRPGHTPTSLWRSAVIDPGR